MAKVSHFRYALRFFITIICWLFFAAVNAQTLGGKAAYNFLSYPASTPVGAAGGINISHLSTDPGFSLQNPALLNKSMHSQVAMHFTNLAAGINGLNLSTAFHHLSSNTTFAGHIFFLHYGNMPQTDAAGNTSGSFNAYDYMIEAAASKSYLEKWQYGGAVKWIQSLYGQYRSSALAFDVGLLYNDSTNGFRAGLVAKNMGLQVKAFENDREELPFDMQLGITKKLLKAPLAFSLTAHHLHRFSVLYNDTSFNNQNGYSNSQSFFKKVFNHFVVATHISIGSHLEATVGYNVLRRSELSTGNAGNGLTGFSAGLTATFQKMQFHYARSSYQKGIGNNQIGISINLQKLSGIGTF